MPLEGVMKLPRANAWNWNDKRRRAMGERIRHAMPG